MDKKNYMEWLNKKVKEVKEIGEIYKNKEKQAKVDKIIESFERWAKKESKKWKMKDSGEIKIYVGMSLFQKNLDMLFYSVHPTPRQFHHIGKNHLPS